MIRLDFLERKMDNVDFEITRYVNDNLQIIIRTLIDYFEDAEEPVDFFVPGLNICRIDWTQMVYDLYRVIESDVVRDYIKPKYEYLLYEILIWWEETRNEGEDGLPLELPVELITKVYEKYKNAEDDVEEYILYAITNYNEYYNILFLDHDFLPDSLEKMLTVYLRSPSFFAEVFPDVELAEYRELMPKDLQERYDEKNKETEKNTGGNYDVGIDIEQMMFDDVMRCCERVQADYSLKDSLEDEINDRFRDLLDGNKLINVRDQTRQGISSTGKRAGEVDILIRIGKMPISIIEALKLTSVTESYIAEHIDKIFKYDTLGYRFNYIVSYVNVKDFSRFYEGYIQFVSSYKYPYEMVDFIIEGAKQYPELRVIETLLNRNGIITKLYHILIHMQN